MTVPAPGALQGVFGACVYPPPHSFPVSGLRSCSNLLLGSGLTQLSAPCWNLSAADAGCSDSSPVFHAELNKSVFSGSCITGGSGCSSSVPLIFCWL